MVQSNKDSRRLKLEVAKKRGMVELKRPGQANEVCVFSQYLLVTVEALQVMFQ